MAQRLLDSLKPLGVWFHVEARAKTTDSLVKKLLTKQHHTFESLPDKVWRSRHHSDIALILIG